MKKIMSLLLVAVMLLGLCACGGNKYAKYESINQKLDAGDYEGAIMEIVAMYEAEQGGETVAEGGSEESDEPTDEERDLLWDYRSAVNNLENYAASTDTDPYISVWVDEADKSYSGIEALKYYYELLQSMGSIDKWLNDPVYMQELYGAENMVNCDRQSILDRFVILPDVTLKQTVTTTDNMENVNTNEGAVWKYDANGLLQTISNSYNLEDGKPWGRIGGTRRYEYDDSGRVSKVKFGSGDSVNAIITPTYDEAGNVINDHAKNNSGEWDYNYSYDENGRMVQQTYFTSADMNQKYVVNYSYDEAGRLSQETKDRYWIYSDGEERLEGKSTKVYTYDANGHLVSAAETVQSLSYDGEVNSETVDAYTFVCDDQGRVVSQTYTPGKTVYSNGDEDTPDYVSKVTETIYGDYYFFVPAA